MTPTPHSTKKRAHKNAAGPTPAASTQDGGKPRALLRRDKAVHLAKIKRRSKIKALHEFLFGKP